jgi:AcrR family transcriptional regulator
LDSLFKPIQFSRVGNLQTDTLSEYTDTMSENYFHLNIAAKGQRDPVALKSDRSREAILTAAIDFLWTNPFRLMTVNGLMSSTNLSRSAFYQYFKDLQELMVTLLGMLEGEILTGASPWILKTGDPVALAREGLVGAVNVCYQRGPFFKAIADAATTDERLEEAWLVFVDDFDEAVTERIRVDQELGLITKFDPKPIAHSLNMLNAYTFISTFGKHPRSDPEPICKALIRMWVSTLYGSQWAESEHSTLRRER